MLVANIDALRPVTQGHRIVMLEVDGSSEQALVKDIQFDALGLDLLHVDFVRIDATDVLGDPSRGAAIVEWMVERATAALCALALGVCEEALRLTAEYTKTREQFGVPLASFQAVGHRAADAYVDTEAIRLTAWQASWRIAAGLPARAAVAVAKVWAADGGQRVVHAAQHLHGGIGVDRDYPLHRYFLYAKQIELTLGGATHHLRDLGRMLGNPSPADGLWS